MILWQRLSQAIGAISLILSAIGYYLSIDTLAVELRHGARYEPETPFFREAFFTMTAIDAAFLVAVVLASIALIRLKPKAAKVYTVVMLSLVVYELGVGVLWALPAPFGRSIASASGVGSMGSAPLLLWPVPLVYPLVSVVIVNLARHKLRGAGSL